MVRHLSIGIPLDYTAADILIDSPPDSALSTRSSLVGGLSSVISVIFFFKKSFVKITILNHIQIASGNSETVLGGKMCNVVKCLKTIVICVLLSMKE